MKKAGPPRARKAGFFRARSKAADASTTSATLTTTLSTNRRFPLPLALGTGLLVVPPLAELGIETGPLHFPLEPAQGAVEALIVLNDDFQEDHLPTC